MNAIASAKSRSSATPNSLIDDIVGERGFLSAFSGPAKKEAAAPPPAAVARADYRRLPFMTIDGDDAKDFDDAVCCRALGDGHFSLLVAIADVAAFVVAGGALDDEAKKRGNSVYLPDRVLPMLPEVLSNGACSLKAGEERLSLACEMEVSGDGDIRRYRFTRATIQSKQRLTYEQATALIDGEHCPKSLKLLSTVGSGFRNARKKRGSLMIERPERRISIRDGVVYDHLQTRTVAHWIIEECMIAANTCAADFLIRHRRPSLHRIHKKPAAESVQKLMTILSALGIPFPRRPTAKDFGKVLEAAAKRDEMLGESLLPIVLGTLSRAEYTPCEKTGHFGLACKKYTHFTSPIRRYPDLLVHRAIIGVLNGTPSPSSGELATVGVHCSETEVSADKAGWECRQRLLCWSVQNRVGEVFSASVSGVLAHGFFVFVPELGIDGMVRIAAVNGYWTFSEERRQFESRNGVIRLGDKMEVRLRTVNPQKGQADFIPAER